MVSHADGPGNSRFHYWLLGEPSFDFPCCTVQGCTYCQVRIRLGLEARLMARTGFREQVVFKKVVHGFGLLRGSYGRLSAYFRRTELEERDCSENRRDY